MLKKKGNKMNKEIVSTEDFTTIAEMVMLIENKNLKNKIKDIMIVTLKENQKKKYK